MINYVEISVIKMEELKKNILKTLLYYDIFSHPLNSDEIYSFLPRNSITKSDVSEFLKDTASSGNVPFAEKNGYYYIKPSVENVSSRIRKENYSQKMWRQAALVTHIIKRFPFVRAVMVTGSLSKNSSDKKSDLDFMLITANNRLWVARTMLMLFKKIFFLNSYKFFCLNYYVTESNLVITERNIFTATEIATIKATYNTELLEEFIKQNKWVKEFFPNYNLCDPMLHTSGCKVNNRPSIFQKITEFLIPSALASYLDKKFMVMTQNHWKKKYPHIKKDEREHMFKSTEGASKTHPGNMQKKILELYGRKLQEFNL